MRFVNHIHVVNKCNPTSILSGWSYVYARARVSVNPYVIKIKYGIFIILRTMHYVENKDYL